MNRLTTKLKAERIQQRIGAPELGEKLKAERIQQRLESLPGWRLDPEGTALQRIYELPSTDAATRLAGLISVLGDAAGFHPTVRIRRERVSVTVDAGRRDGLTDLDFDLAELFSLTPAAVESPPEPGVDEPAETPLRRPS